MSGTLEGTTGVIDIELGDVRCLFCGDTINGLFQELPMHERCHNTLNSWEDVEYLASLTRKSQEYFRRTSA